MNSFKYVIYESLQNNLKISADINFRSKAIDPNGQEYFYSAIKTNKDDFVTAKPKSCLTLSYIEKDLFPEPSIYIGIRDLRNFKAAIATVLDRVYQPDLFVSVNGEQIINSKYLDAVVFRTSSAKDNSVAFKLCIGSFNNGQEMLGVIMEISKAEGRACAMPITELETVYDTLCSFNLLEFSFIMTAAELNSLNPKYLYKAPAQQNNYQQRNTNNFGYQNQVNRPANYNQYVQFQQGNSGYPQNVTYQQQPGYTDQVRGVQQNFRNVQQPSYTQSSGTVTTPTIQPRTQTVVSPRVQQQQTPVVNNSTNNKIPAKSRMEMMEETTIDEFDLDDSAALSEMLGSLGDD